MRTPVLLLVGLCLVLSAVVIFYSSAPDKPSAIIATYDGDVVSGESLIFPVAICAPNDCEWRIERSLLSCGCMGLADGAGEPLSFPLLIPAGGSVDATVKVDTTGKGGLAQFSLWLEGETNSGILNQLYELRAEISPAWLCEPSRLSFIDVVPGQHRTAQILVYDGSGGELQIEEVETSSSSLSVNLEPGSGAMRRARVTYGERDFVCVSKILVSYTGGQLRSEYVRLVGRSGNVRVEIPIHVRPAEAAITVKPDTIHVPRRPSSRTLWLSVNPELPAPVVITSFSGLAVTLSEVPQKDSENLYRLNLEFSANAFESIPDGAQLIIRCGNEEVHVKLLQVRSG